MKRNYNWSFQAQGKFNVTSTIPGNEKAEVPLNTGIEFVFSQDGLGSPNGFIEISPDIDYQTKIVDNTLAIIPQSELQPETTYTVTLKRGYNLSVRNDPIDQDYTFTFQTKEGSKPKRRQASIYINSNFLQSHPTEPLGFKVHTSSWNNDVKLMAKAYRFPNANQFIESRKYFDEVSASWKKYYPDKNVANQNLTLAMEESVNVQKQDNIEFIQLPHNLLPGYYLIKLEVDGEPISSEVWYQSSELAGHISVGKDQTIVWINNLSSKSPSSNSTVRNTDSGGTWITDTSGIAKLPSSTLFFGNTPSYFETTDSGGNSLVLPSFPGDYATKPGETDTHDFWSYLYTDKTLYTPNDSVNFWGVIKYRDTGVPPSNALIRVTKSYPEEVVENIPISMASDGSFIGNFDFVDLNIGRYQLKLMVNNAEIASAGISVEAYTKPDMKIDVIGNKKAIFAGDSVEFTARASFFDGTPGSNLDLHVYSNTGKDRIIEADQQGEIKYTLETSYSGSNRYYPKYESITVTPQSSIESVIQGSGSVRVFGSKLMLTTERDQQGDTAKFSTTINHVDLSGLNNGTSSKVKGDPAANQEIQIKITENWTEVKESGTYYDFVEKVTHKKYSYERKSNVIEEKTLKTNESGNTNHEFKMKSGRSYTVDLTIKDEDEHITDRNLYFYYSNYSNQVYSQSRTYDKYELNLDGNNGTNLYSKGDEVKVKITKNGDELSDPNMTYLYNVAQRGRQDVKVTNSPNYSFVFEERMVPNAYVDSTIFDGRHYIDVDTYCKVGWYCGDSYWYRYDYGYNTFSGLQVAYNKEDSKLDLDIKSSKDEYAPGEDASITVSVQKDGEPVSGANVNLVLIDEALVAIGGGREPNILPSLYTNVPHQIYYVYSSHKAILPDISDAEKGGGGGEYRSVFKDIAEFDQKTTNEDGEAIFQFTLPDNITSWHIYSQAVTNDLMAGQSDASVISTKDFFVTSKFSPTLLEEDRAYIAVNSFGKALNPGDKTDFEVAYLSGNTEIEKFIGEKEVYKDSFFPIPELSIGNYFVTTFGESKGYTDGVKLPLEVTDSRVSQPFSTSNSIEKEPLTDLGIGDYDTNEPVSAVVSDKGKGIFFNDLVRYCYGRYSNRVEKKISATHAKDILSEKFDYDNCLSREEYTFSDFQNTDGGIGKVTWGGSDLGTSAWSNYLIDDEFDENQLRNYFESQFNSPNVTTLSKITAAWGLSLLGESKILYLQSVADVGSFEERVQTGIALASLGDTERARSIYLDLLADYGYVNTPYIRVDRNQNRGTTADIFVVDTSKLLLLGDLVEQKYNDGLFEYVQDYQYGLDNYIIDLSQIAFIENEIERLPDEDTVFTLTNASGTTTNTLTKGRSKTYNFSTSDIRNFSATLISGKADITTRYTVGVNRLKNEPKDARLAISKTYSKAKDNGTPIVVGDIVKVTINASVDLENTPKGAYVITDTLPSGLKYISNPSSYGLSASGYPYHDGENIKSYVYNSRYCMPNGKINVTYYTRVTGVGEFKVEPATIQSQRELRIFNMTDEDILDIKVY